MPRQLLRSVVKSVVNSFIVVPLPMLYRVSVGVKSHTDPVNDLLNGYKFDG